MKPINIDENCKFLKDIESNPTMAMYNLITSKGAVQLWTKGIKPHSNWRLKDIKIYFGITGNADKLYTKLSTMLRVLNENKKGEQNENK